MTSFSRSVIETVDGIFNLLARYLSKVGFLRKILTKQTIGVFVNTTFPRRVRVRKVCFGIKRPCYLFMMHKLRTIIKSKSFYFAFVLFEQSNDRLANHLR